MTFNINYSQTSKETNGLRERPYYIGQFVGIKSKAIWNKEIMCRFVYG
jgi:hypothetical protein